MLLCALPPPLPLAAYAVRLTHNAFPFGLRRNNIQKGAAAASSSSTDGICFVAYFEVSYYFFFVIGEKEDASEAEAEAISGENFFPPPLRIERNAQLSPLASHSSPPPPWVRYCVLGRASEWRGYVFRS